MSEQVTTYITIGNSDDGLTQAEWSEFHNRVNGLVGIHAERVYGVFVSEPTSPFQNACWSAEILPEERDRLMPILAEIARRYRQDSIAWVEGIVHMVKATPIMLTTPEFVPEGGILRPAPHWEQIYGVKVADPDGWRADGIPFDQPITESGFFRRFANSTVDARVNTATHNPWDETCTKHLHGEPRHPGAHCYRCRPV